MFKKNVDSSTHFFVYKNDFNNNCRKSIPISGSNLVDTGFFFIKTPKYQATKSKKYFYFPLNSSKK